MIRASHLLILILLAAAAPVSGQNMLGNPTFETDLSEWENPYGHPAFWDPMDYASSASSGSAWAVNNSSNGSSAILRQWFPASEGTEFDFEAQIYPPSGQTGTGYGHVRLHFYSTLYPTGCGDSLGISYTTDSSVSDSWNHVTGSATAPAGTECIVVFLGVRKWETGSTEEFGVYFDMVELSSREGEIFSDGFESGSTSAWS